MAKGTFERKKPHVNIGIGLDLRQTLPGLDRQYCSGERRLAVVDVADRADVDVRLLAFEYRFSHVELE